MGRADVLLQVRSLAGHESAPPPGLDLVRRGQTVIGLLDPVWAPPGVRALSERGRRPWPWS